MTSSRKTGGGKEKVSPKKFCLEKSRACDYCELRGRGFCGHLTDPQKDLLARISRLAILDAHENVFRQGEETENIYVVRSGVLCLYQRLLDGRRQVIGFAKPGDLLLFPLGKYNDYGADTVDSTYLCQFRRDDFVDFLRREPDFLAALAAILHEELKRMRRLIALLGQKHAEPKMAQFLLSLHESYAGQNMETTLVPVRLPQADIADFLGLTVETVNRTLARFVRDAIIRVAGSGIDLINIRRLREIAETC